LCDHKPQKPLGRAVFACQGDPETPKPTAVGFEKGIIIIMRKRNNRLWVHLSDDEYAVVKHNIIKTGLSKEAYIRSVLLGYIPKEKPDERFYAAMKDLAGIANNVNQLARKTNAVGSIYGKTLQIEADKWGKFQTEIREEFLLPEKM